MFAFSGFECKYTPSQYMSKSFYINLCPFTRAHYPNVICFPHTAVCLHYYQIFCSFDSVGYFLICPTHPVLTISDVRMSIIKSSWYHVLTTYLARVSDQYLVYMIFL
ncbi:hypothetical protein Hanom_Chr07g00602201 [Helianthus anomalus]